MAGMTPDQVADLWGNRLAGSGDKIRAGVAAVQVAPGQLAARNKAGYVAGVTSSQDKWAARTASVPLSTWQSDMLEKGLPRIASGASAAKPKMAAFLTQFLPFVERGRSTLPPRGGLDQNIARSAAMIRYTAGFKRTGPGG